MDKAQEIHINPPESLEIPNDIGLLVKTNGDFWIVHNNIFSNTPSWAEYEQENEQLFLVWETGETTRLEASFISNTLEKLKKSKTAFFIGMADKTHITSLQEIPVVVRNYN